MNILNKEYRLFNINNMIKVKLTGKGKQIYIDNTREDIKNLKNIGINLYDGDPFKKLENNTDSEGYLNIQLWEFMSIFGSYMYNGMNIVIGENNIIMCKDDIKA